LLLYIFKCLELYILGFNLFYVIFIYKLFIYLFSSNIFILIFIFDIYILYKNTTNY
jgi:hypothetical protein